MGFISRTSGPTLVKKALGGDMKAVGKLSRMLGVDRRTVMYALNRTNNIINK